MISLFGKQTFKPKQENEHDVLSRSLVEKVGRVSRPATLLVSICCMVLMVGAQTEQRRQTTMVQDMATAQVPSTQLEFTGKETFELNGGKGTRYKLEVTNRASHPDFLWRLSPNLPACGKNKNPSRTWVEIFGSPGDKRLGGFCGLRSADDLAHLWFAIPAGEKGPQCVYIVMTDRNSGKKYVSNRVCSRSFTVVTGRLATGGQSQAIEKDHSKGWIELNSVQFNKDQPEKGLTDQANPNAVNGGRGWDQIATYGHGNMQVPDSGEPNSLVQIPKGRLAKGTGPDLRIERFLFAPTNDKALRVQVVNSGQAPSGACRLVLTIRKINGIAAGRKTHVNVPALASGAADWLLIDARSILPDNVSLQTTTFKLNVDATGIVLESDEGNNEVWHNL